MARRWWRCSRRVRRLLAIPVAAAAKIEAMAAVGKKRILVVSDKVIPVLRFIVFGPCSVTGGGVRLEITQ